MSAPRFGSRKKVTKSELRGVAHGARPGKAPAKSIAEMAKLEPIRGPAQDAPCTPATPEASHEPRKEA